jgi:plasmid stabilization system protein ParE
MSFEVVLLSRAQKDFDTILNWLSAHSPTTLIRWCDSFERILDRLEREPLSFGFAPENEVLAASVRQAIFRTGKGFVYRLLFVVVGKEVRVLHIRGPGQDYVMQPNQIS